MCNLGTSGFCLCEKSKGSHPACPHLFLLIQSSVLKQPEERQAVSPPLESTYRTCCCRLWATLAATGHRPERTQSLQRAPASPQPDPSSEPVEGLFPTSYTLSLNPQSTPTQDSVLGSVSPLNPFPTWILPRPGPPTISVTSPV